MNDLFKDKHGIDWFLGAVEDIGETFKCPCGYVADYGAPTIHADMQTKLGRAVSIGIYGNDIVSVRCPICNEEMKKG